MNGKRIIFCAWILPYSVAKVPVSVRGEPHNVIDFQRKLIC